MSKMTVKEILLASAQTLQLDDVVAFLSGKGEESEKTDVLLRCFNTVENELALDYLPLYAETEVETTTGVIEYSSLSHAIVRVLRVRDEGGNSVAFKLFPSYVKTSSGRVTIGYTYAPTEKAITGVSDYVLQASIRLFTYGIAAEYSLLTGDFEGAAIWDKKYKEAIEAAYKSRPCTVLRSRRWA